MFGKKNRPSPPDQPFSHTDDCRIVKADPDVEILWSRLEYGQWRRECVCGAESWTEPADKRVRLDPYNPATSRHGGPCEFKDETNPAILRVLLKVKPGMDEGYSWVECGACGFAWPVPDFAEERVG